MSSVTGMTCSHCIAAVIEEVSRLDGVSAVDVDLNTGGDSRVTVTSAAPLPVDAVRPMLKTVYAKDFAPS